MVTLPHFVVVNLLFLTPGVGCFTVGSAPGERAAAAALALEADLPAEGRGLSTL